MDGIVYDKNIFGSHREIDQNGFLRVDSCNITKTQVACYLGREIPGWRDMGLESEKIYYVLRPENELRKAVPTFNNLPLTREHIEVDVENVPKDKIVGSLGDHAEYADGYIKNNLIVYDQKDIDLIMSGKKKELSCGYRYTPVREHGTFDGQEYDFVMTDIIGNHIALVKEGRAGHDVVVSDTIDKVKEKFMNLFRKKEIVSDEKQEVVEDKKLSDKEQEKVGGVMKEFKEGELKSGSGEKVTDPKQAIAIALSEADKMAKDKDIPDEQEKPEKAGDKDALVKGEEEMTEEVKEALAEDAKKAEEAKEAEDACAKDEGKEDDKLTEDKDIDKRKLIDEIGGILKSSKVDDEVIRTVMKKCEEMAYNKSESGEADDEKEEDLKGKEKEAFAEGVDFGEKKEKEEPKKLDSEHESEGAKKADEEEAEKKKEAEDEDKKEKKEMAKDSAMAMDVDAIKQQIREEMKADFMARETARKAVRSIVGDVNVMTFDSTEEIYKFACEKAGMDLNEIVSYKDAFKGLTAGKSKLALDASPKCGSNEECFKNIRIA